MNLIAFNPKLSVIKLIMLTICVIFYTSTSWSIDSQEPQVQAFINKMVNEHDFNKKELTQQITNLKKQQRVLDLIQAPAEAKPWHEYRNLFITSQQINNGVKFWQEHKDTLEKAEQEYGVPAEVIVSILGVETRWGQNSGSFPVYDTLATLSFYYPRRSEFFTRELEQFLIMAREENLDPTTLLGSYAGAMGQAQFMPSSYRAYAVDFTKDGKRDIWQNPADAIGSVANYLAVHGWQANEPIAVTASVTEQQLITDSPIAKTGRANLKPQLTILEWQEKDVSPNQPQPNITNDTKVTLIELEQPNDVEYWFGMNNFYAITRYNISALYAMTVFQLGESIKNQKKTS